MTELKPCPFCGGEAHLDNTWILSGARKWVVHCIKCGASIGFYETKEKAIEAWNRRTDNAISANERED